MPHPDRTLAERIHELHPKWPTRTLFEEGTLTMAMRELINGAYQLADACGTKPEKGRRN